MKNKQTNNEIIEAFEMLNNENSQIDINKIAELLSKNNFDEMIEQMLSEEISDPISEDEVYEEIVGYYFILIKNLKINSFKTFRFASYDYCRKIIIDDKKYDLDEKFYDDDHEEVSEALCAIDSLIASLAMMNLSEDEKNALNEDFFNDDDELITNSSIANINNDNTDILRKIEEMININNNRLK